MPSGERSARPGAQAGGEAPEGSADPCPLVAAILGPEAEARRDRLNAVAGAEGIEGAVAAVAPADAGTGEDDPRGVERLAAVLRSAAGRLGRSGRPGGPSAPVVLLVADATSPALVGRALAVAGALGGAQGPLLIRRIVLTIPCELEGGERERVRRSLRWVERAVATQGLAVSVVAPGSLADADALARRLLALARPAVVEGLERRCAPRPGSATGPARCVVATVREGQLDPGVSFARAGAALALQSAALPAAAGGAASEAPGEDRSAYLPVRRPGAASEAQGLDYARAAFFTGAVLLILFGFGATVAGALTPSVLFLLVLFGLAVLAFVRTGPRAPASAFPQEPAAGPGEALRGRAAGRAREVMEAAGMPRDGLRAAFGPDAIARAQAAAAEALEQAAASSAAVEVGVGAALHAAENALAPVAEKAATSPAGLEARAAALAAAARPGWPADPDVDRGVEVRCARPGAGSTWRVSVVRIAPVAADATRSGVDAAGAPGNSPGAT